MKPNIPNISSPQVKIDINDCPSIACECSSILWDNAFIVKRISPLYSPTGQEQFANVPVVICKKCGTDIRVAIESGVKRIIS